MQKKKKQKIKTKILIKEEKRERKKFILGEQPRTKGQGWEAKGWVNISLMVDCTRVEGEMALSLLNSRRCPTNKGTAPSMNGDTVDYLYRRCAVCTLSRRNITEIASIDPWNTVEPRWKGRALARYSDCSDTEAENKLF